MENWDKTQQDFYRYQAGINSAKERVRNMPEDKVKKILELAQSPNDITQLPEDDKLVITVICQNEAQREIEGMTEAEVASKGKELCSKHTKHCTEGTEALTRYENELWGSIRRHLRKIAREANEPEKE